MNEREIIMALAERLFICSRLLSCAAMRLGWDEDEVREWAARMRDYVFSSEPAGSPGCVKIPTGKVMNPMHEMPL